MTRDTGTPVGRIFIVGLLAVATLGFGLAGLCGAAFTVMGLSGLSSPGPENFSGAILVIAVPSLLIGGGLAFWCGVLLSRRFRKTDA
ncbi:MAG: hypothetical protein JF607_27610 [Burkholderiales bacterium]|jgi:hypothetical protein|nr:hypothetical protein [Burkholderiales bacterium]